MKVVYFHQHFSTPDGATGIRSYEMARALVAKGHQVVMVCGSYGAGKTGLSGDFRHGCRRGNVDGIDVVEFQLSYSNRDSFLSRTKTFLRFSWRSVQFALSESCDVLFATTTPLTAGIPGIVGRWIGRKRFVFEVRDLWPELPRAMGVIKNPIVLALMSWLEWASYRSAHRLIGLSPGIVEGIVRRGVSRDNVALIPNGCDIGIFGDKSSSWRPEGVAPNDLMAIFAGTHGIANGLDAALDAAAVLKARGRLDIKMVLIGDGSLKEEYIRRAKREQLTNIVFCAPVNKSKLAGLMAASDVGMQLLANVPAFYYGTSPNKFFDYLAAGLPSLINYPGWLAEVVASHECGLPVPPADPQAFADSLVWAADNRSALKQMGRRAEVLAQGGFSRERLASQFVAWIESAAENAPKALGEVETERQSEHPNER
jgi:glycosyltransferase involved in cell wall biosynthesis